MAHKNIKSINSNSVSNSNSNSNSNSDSDMKTVLRNFFQIKTNSLNGKLKCDKLYQEMIISQYLSPQNIPTLAP